MAEHRDRGDRPAIERYWYAVSTATSTPAGPSAAIVTAVCGAEILGLVGYSIVPALLPQFIEAWSLTNTQAGWLAGSVSAGYMLAVIPLVGATDRWSARHIYLASSTLSALSCFGIALCDSLLPALAFRALAGIAMAGMYMPGLQALTQGLGERSVPASRLGTPARSRSARRCRSCSAASGRYLAGAALLLPPAYWVSPAS